MTKLENHKPINYEDWQINCPHCNSKLKYVAYTAFVCRKCKLGFSIGITTHLSLEHMV